MSEEKKTILTQVMNEVQESKRKQVKGELKTLLDDLEKSRAVTNGIIDSIVEKLVAVGEDEESVRSMLK